MKIPEKNMICIQCQKEIKNNEHFIELIEWNNSRLLKSNRCHYSCWEDLMTRKKQIGSMMGIATNLFENLKEQGIIKEEKKEEYVLT